MASSTLSITVEFGGGAETLFDNKKKINIELPMNDSNPWTIKKLISYLRQNYLNGSPELFCFEDTVRPGILVLVNDTDWELLGDKNYNIQLNDNILFISTLHGG